MGGRLRTAVAVAALAAAGALAPTAQGATSGWVPTLPVTQQSWQQLSAFPDGTAYVLDRGGSAITLWHSGDFGMAWDALTYLPAGASGFLTIRFASPTVGYAVNFDRVLRTTDGATTAHSWKALPQPPVPGHDWIIGHTLGVTGSTVAVGGERMHPVHLGCNMAASENIWTSHDDGQHWITATLPKHTDVSSIDYLNRNLGVAVVYDLHGDPDDPSSCSQIGDRTSLFVTRDGGRHFERAFRCGESQSGLCWTAKFVTASTVIGGRNNGGTVISRDGGRTFADGPRLDAELSGNLPRAWLWIQGLDFTDQVLYATTKLGGAFRSTDLGRTWTRERSCDSAYTLGIGEVAAFDGTRAIAGGPTCVATRVTAPGAASPAAVPSGATTSTKADVVQQSAGVTRSVHDGALRVTWRDVRPAG